MMLRVLSLLILQAGDDLRQDMLTMQLIRIMDKLWLKEGLDLKMVTFSCQPTGLKRGNFISFFIFCTFM
jgi:phosphatidylinositol-4-phosphate 3-kinase